MILPWGLICDKAMGIRTVNWGWRDGAAAEEYVLHSTAPLSGSCNYLSVIPAPGDHIPLIFLNTCPPHTLKNKYLERKIVN